MDKPRRNSETLLEARSAIWGYLDELLSEIPPEPDPEPPRTTPAATPRPARQEVAAPRPAPNVAEAATRKAAAPAPAPEPREPVTETVPEWARQDFQALLFQVGRLSLAVPLIKLHSVIPWTDGISALPNRPRWCLGAMRYRDRNMVVIDTARLVLPPDRREDPADGAAGHGHILVVGDGRWGLACHTVGEVIRLRPDEVKWRGAHSRRPWLAGTVLGRLCALMDTGAFADMLGRGDAATTLKEGRDDG
jgi:purine-binding chemotaxis protein CheW